MDGRFWSVFFGMTCCCNFKRHDFLRPLLAQNHRNACNVTTKLHALLPCLVVCYAGGQIPYRLHPYDEKNAMSRFQSRSISWICESWGGSCSPLVRVCFNMLSPTSTCFQYGGEKLSTFVPKHLTG